MIPAHGERRRYGRASTAFSGAKPATPPSTDWLARLQRRKAELLRVLQHPDIPLHTNGSENDIRACVAKRKISGGTMSTAGRTARDVTLGLMKTCSKLGVSFFRYLGDRLHVPGAITVLPLPDLVRQAAAAA